MFECVYSSKGLWLKSLKFFLSFVTFNVFHLPRIPDLKGFKRIRHRLVSDSKVFTHDSPFALRQDLILNFVFILLDRVNQATQYQHISIHTTQNNN